MLQQGLVEFKNKFGHYLESKTGFTEGELPEKCEGKRNDLFYRLCKRIKEEYPV